MLHGSTHPGVAGSELTRLLARLGPGPAPEARPVFAERLGQWLGWTGAIALASALNGAASPGPAAHARPAPVAGREEADFQRVRAALAAANAAGPREPAASPSDFGPYRRFCHARQQAMHEAVAGLRQRLRQALAQRGPALARLAAVDAVVAEALAEREHALLGLVPLRLQARFEQLQAQADAQASFPLELQQLLQAELAHRLLPAQGLLAALREPPSTRS